MMKTVGIASAVILLFLSACASQQDVIAIDDRLAAIERKQSETDSVSRQSSKALEEEDQSIRTQSAGFRVTLDQYREELRSLRGEIEETQYQLRQSAVGGDTVDKRLEGIEGAVRGTMERVARLEQYLNLEPPPMRPPVPVGTSEGEAPSETAAAPSPPADSDAALYDSAKTAFDAGNYQAAREGFESVLKRFPKSNYANNAQFWIGETYYREKWYEKAILEYQKVIEKYPKGNKVQAALLKQGFAFDNLGDKTNAKLILQELVKKHPDSNEAKVAQKKLKEMN